MPSGWCCFLLLLLLLLSRSAVPVPANEIDWMAGRTRRNQRHVIRNGGFEDGQKPNCPRGIGEVHSSRLSGASIERDGMSYEST